MDENYKDYHSLYPFLGTCFVVKESKAHEEMFHINNLYAGYKDKVSKLYAKGYKLNDSVVKYMSAAFGLKPSPSDILAYLSDEISLNLKLADL